MVGSSRIAVLSMILLGFAGSSSKGQPTKAAGRAAKQPNGSASGDTLSEPLVDLLTSPACRDVRPDTLILDISGRDFVVTAAGNVLDRPRRPIDEGQKVHVTVLADERLEQSLVVTRKSEFRPVRVTNILGSGVRFTSPVLIRALVGSNKPKCVAAQFELNDFASGRGEVDISALTDDGRASLGTFDFAVDPLYTGAFTIGAIRTRVNAPTFGTTARIYDTTLVAGGPLKRVTDTVVTRTVENGDRILYVVTYVPFLWRDRDVKVTPSRFIERFNPMFGAVLNDVFNNGLIGVNFDILARVYLMWGVHAGRVTDLDSRSRQMVGSPIGSGSVSTTKKWRYDQFVGVSVDITSGVDFLKTALSAGSGGQ